jgi:hypothetical protein
LFLTSDPLAMDTSTQALVEALKQAVAEPGEQRLFRTGKLPGIFPSRTGASGEAAAQALRDGLVEISRNETKGKVTTEWVRVTPRGLEFIHQHESPVQALRDLQAVLKMTQDGIPHWMGELQKELQALGNRLTEQAQRITRRIEALSQSVDDALAHAEAGQSQVPTDLAAALPWAVGALDYLDHRKTAGLANSCPLPDLFAALRAKLPEMTVTEYHAGLRQLHERKVLRLVPYQGRDPLPEPEYALLEGAATFYHVAHAQRSNAATDGLA